MAPYLHTHALSPIVRRSSSHWLMWGSLSISFHFLLRPFLLPPPPERDEREKQMKTHQLAQSRRHPAEVYTPSTDIGYGAQTHAFSWVEGCVLCSINNASASTQQDKVKLKPQGKDATIPYLCARMRAPKHAKHRQRQAGSSRCVRTGRVVKNAAKLQSAWGIRARADRHTNTSGSLPNANFTSLHEPAAMTSWTRDGPQNGCSWSLKMECE